MTNEEFQWKITESTLKDSLFTLSTKDDLERKILKMNRKPRFYNCLFVAVLEGSCSELFLINLVSDAPQTSSSRPQTPQNGTTPTSTPGIKPTYASVLNTSPAAQTPIIISGSALKSQTVYIFTKNRKKGKSHIYI